MFHFSILYMYVGVRRGENQGDVDLSDYVKRPGNGRENNIIVCADSFGNMKINDIIANENNLDLKAKHLRNVKDPDEGTDGDACIANRKYNDVRYLKTRSIHTELLDYLKLTTDSTGVSSWNFKDKYIHNIKDPIDYHGIGDLGYNDK